MPWVSLGRCEEMISDMLIYDHSGCHLEKEISKKKIIFDAQL